MLNHTYFTSYADDITPYRRSANLEQISKPFLKWFKDNKMKLNPDKYHLILTGKENSRINVANVFITSYQNGKLLGVFYDEKIHLDVTLKTCVTG